MTLILILLLSLQLTTHSNNTYIDQEEPDTNEAVDTLEVPIRVLVIPRMGGIQDESLESITYLEQLLLEYTSPVDNVTIYPGIYVRHKGAVGQPHGVTAWGTEWRAFGHMIDGRPAHDPMTGVYDLNLFPTEFIEEIEYLPPSRSFLYQRNAVGSSINIRTQNYIAPSPYSKIRYSEGPNNYSQTDVVLSQDIRPGVNIMAGMQRQFFGRADPNDRFRGRFPNMYYRNQNYRSKLRWNFPEVLNVSTAYSYTLIDNGLSGGVDVFATPPEDIFSELEATMRSTLSFQRVKRHDLTVSASAQLLPDSTDTSNLTVFYSNHYRDYREADRENRPDTLLYRNAYRALLSGVDFKQWFTFGPARFHAGGAVHDVHITESPATGKLHEREASLFFRSILQPLHKVTANTMIRSDWLRGTTYVSYGADLTCSPDDFFSVTAGGVHSYRHPTLQELYWQDSTVTRPESFVAEGHDLLFATVTLQPADFFSVIVGASYRSVANPIYYEQSNIVRTFPSIAIMQGDRKEIITNYVKLRYRIWDLTLEGLINYFHIKENGTRTTPLPAVDVHSALTYRGLLFNGALDLQVKLEAQFIGEQYGLDFDPETFFSPRQDFARIGPSAVFNGNVIGKIGNAYVHITYQNILSTEYMTTPFYPMPESYLRFGITWEFLN